MSRRPLFIGRGPSLQCLPKIKATKDMIEEIQSQLNGNQNSEFLHTAVKEAKASLQKFLLLEENMLKQKSRDRHKLG